MDGWAQGGQALAQAMSGGSGGAYGQAYDGAMSRGHTLQKKLAEARIKSDEMRARENLDVKMAELFAEQPEMGAAVSTMMRAGVGGNFDQMTRGGINMDRQQILRTARDAAASGDMNAANAMLGVYQGRPTERTKIAGNTMYDPYAAPADQMAQVTPYGQGYLSNQAEGVRGRNEAAMVRANRPPATRAGARTKEVDAYDAAVKEAAAAAFSDAKLDDADIVGLTVKDFEHALRTRGEVKDRRGQVLARFNVNREDFEAGGDAAPRAAPTAQPGSTPAQAMANEAVIDPVRAVSGGPVSSPTPPRQDNAAATRQVASKFNDGLPPMLDYEGGGDGRSAPRRPAPAAAAPASFEAFNAMQSTELPPQAKAQLREGEITTFANGQQWVLDGGKAVRVK